MYPVSDTFRDEVTSSDQVALVEVSVVLDGTQLGELTITQGSVDCDGTRDGALRSLSLTIAPHPDAFDWLTTAGAEIVVGRGLRLPGGDEMVPLGVFVLDADLEEGADGTLTLTAADRSQRISRARWTDPYKVPAGSNVGDAVARLLRACWAGCPVGATLDAVTKLTGARVVYLDGSDSDPWKDARALAASAGLDLYFDGDGVAQVRDAPDPARDPVVMTYHAGEEGVVVSETRRALLSQMYNGVVVTAEGSNVARPKRGEAWDDDPGSPTYCDGPMGRVPLFYSSPLLTSQDDVDSAADTMLARVKRPLEQVSFSLVPNPALEAFDVVEFVAADESTRRFMFDVVSLPLDASGAMTATARQTEVTE